MNRRGLDRRGFIGGAVASIGVALAEWRAWAAEEGLPGYYAEHLASVTEKVLRNAKHGADGFWFITDPHVKTNRCKSGRLLAELIRRTGVTRVLCGGDIPEAFGKGHPTDKDAVDFSISRFREHWVDPIRAAGGRLYAAKGNHDFTVRHSMEPQDGNRGFTYSGAMARKIIVGEWTEAGVVVNREDPSGCYYYFDDPQSRLRFIVADSCDSEESGDVGWGVRYGMHEKQLKWLDAQAFGTIPSGWSTVVMHHIPVTGVVGSDDDAKTFAAFRALLNKFRNRILLDLTGHTHAERQTFQNGILHVTEPCDAAYADYIAGSSPWCGDLPPKQAGTIFEQTFDAVQIDRERGCAYFTRVGGGQDRVIHLTARKVKVGETVQFRSGHLSGDVKFGCYDGDSVGRKPNPSNCWNPLIAYKCDFAEISDGGLLTARKPGPVMVLAMDKARNKEIFPVEVCGCV